MVRTSFLRLYAYVASGVYGCLRGESEFVKGSDPDLPISRSRLLRGLTPISIAALAVGRTPWSKADAPVAPTGNRDGLTPLLAGFQPSPLAPNSHSIRGIGDNSPLVYEVKLTPFSSHVLLVASLPAEGSGKRVLDVGCGNGYLGKILADRGYEVTGIEQPGGTNQRFPPEVRLVEADLENGLPELDGKFDYILCADVLEHLRDPLRLLKEIRGKFTPGGVLIASLPNSGNLYFRLVILSGRFPQDNKGLFDRTHMRFFTWDGWRELLDNGGFVIDRTVSSCIPIGLAAPAWRESLPIRLSERISYEMAKVWKRMFAYQFIVTARVR